MTGSQGAQLLPAAVMELGRVFQGHQQLPCDGNPSPELEHTNPGKSPAMDVPNSPSPQSLLL